jgi:flagellar protein FliO/FliZ
MDSLAFIGSFFKMLFSLAVVLGLLLGAMYFVRRMLQQTSTGASDNSAINVIANRYLGPKSSIMLVEILGKVIVVGISYNRMSHLATISEAEALERLKHIGRQEKNLPSLADYIKRNKVAMRFFDRFGKDCRK